jgi:hypothetical protein
VTGGSGWRGSAGDRPGLPPEDGVDQEPDRARSVLCPAAAGEVGDPGDPVVLGLGEQLSLMEIGMVVGVHGSSSGAFRCVMY